VDDPADVVRRGDRTHRHFTGVQVAATHWQMDGETIEAEAFAMRPAECYAAAHAAYQRLAATLRTEGARIIDAIYNGGALRLADAVDAAENHRSDAVSALQRTHCP